MGAPLGTWASVGGRRVQSKHKSPLKGKRSVSPRAGGRAARPRHRTPLGAPPLWEDAHAPPHQAPDDAACPPCLRLTLCSIPKAEAPARRHCGSRIRNPASGTSPSLLRARSAVSAAHQAVPSSVSQEGSALRESRSVQAREVGTQLDHTLGIWGPVTVQASPSPTHMMARMRGGTPSRYLSSLYPSPERGLGSGPASPQKAARPLSR